MRFTSLPQTEAKFRTTGNDGEYTFKKIVADVKGENLKLEALFAQPKGRSGYFHAVEHPKQRIVIHYTTGNIRSDMSTMTRNGFHVSVPFVIARDGTIYQLFSSKFWSGHIGKTPLNAGNAQDKVTISIELSNYGYLIARDGNLETFYSRMKDPKTGKIGPVDIYCSLTETEAYRKIHTPFREQSFYAAYTPQQYDSLIVLLRFLTAKYEIPRQFLPEPKRYQTTSEVLDFKGIVTHVNYRSSGKWDIGPAFDWKRVIEGVQAPAFVPEATRSQEDALESMERETTMATFTSEEELEALMPQPAGEPTEETFFDEDQLLAEKLELERAAAPKPKLYALLIGIDDYPREVLLEGKVSFPPLRGCVADVRKMETYLNDEGYFEKEIRVLTNREATKEAIVAAFRNHLGKAAKGDTVLFYFSGHGTQEHADRSVWQSDTDGRLECIACYYNEHTATQFLLADKELRFLINEVARKEPHIVALFDCCHSGDNTRNGGFVTAAFRDAVEKRIPFAFKQRPWSEFVFGEQVSAESIKSQGEAMALPQGKHVQISACESDESAMEVNGEGVFTKTLLQVLRASGGRVGYGELRSRVRQYLRNVFSQKPRIYAAGDQRLLYTAFLAKKIKPNTTVAEITFNEERGWQLNLGAVHGIGADTTVQVLLQGDETLEARITEVQIDHAYIEVGATLDTRKVFKAEIEGLLSASIPVHIANADGLLEDQQALLDAVMEDTEAYIRPVDKEASAAYVVRSGQGQYYLSLPGDAYRPLVAPVKASADDAAKQMAAMLKHVSQWTFLKELKNKDRNTRLSEKAIRIEVVQEKRSGQQAVVPQKEGTCMIGFEQGDDGWQTGLCIRITNTTAQSLYCCALYLTNSFQAYDGMLNPATYLLTAGATVELNIEGNPLLPVRMNEVYRWYNWPYWQDHLKVIYSTTEFDAHALSLDALPLPPVPGERGMGAAKSIAFAPEERALRLDGWSTKMVTLQFQNPEYNTIPEQDLSLFLQDEDLGDFALGIYFEAVQQGLDVQYRLRPEIKVEKEPGVLERGFVSDRVIDLANWWARGRRNRHYHQMLQRFPQRPRIVSEGDSWFQHPLVVDTIDHLARTYPVYCVAAAGDTLRNYVSGNKRRGQYFLDAIEEQDPQFFLISGGGNDILGEQFRGYLLPYTDDGVPEGENPGRLVKQSLFDELAALKEIYRTLFGDLAVNKPRLKILVHGYDYPVKLDSPNKGWLGRYMIEKGIRAGDRRAIIRMIMDEFNTMLKGLADEFPQVSYLDMRGVVRYNAVNGPDQWYDEIHPNDDGFQQVAMRFLRRINDLAQPVQPQAAASPGETERGEITRGAMPESTGWDGTRGLESMPSALEGMFAESVAPHSPVPAPTAAPPSNFIQGQMDYNIPGSMEVGRQYKCGVKIGGLEVATALVQFEDSDGVDTIRISDEMSVRLIDAAGGNNFSIHAISMERQAILPGEVTTWSFNVSPLKAGAFPLALRITIHLGNRSKDLDILEKEVVVKAGIGEERTPTEGDDLRRILFLAANPYDTQRLRLGAESREIQDALHSIADRKIVFTMNMAVTTRTLMRSIIREKPDVVHFSGHGEAEGLCLETEDGASKMIDEVSLAAIFSQFDKTVDCVVLNACYSEPQAKAIAQHIPYVVGMQKGVKDKAALAFSRVFYESLAGGMTIPEAFHLGTAAMRLESPGQEVVPVLMEKNTLVQPEV